MSGLFSDFAGIFFPPLCPACSEVLMKHEDVLCLGCMLDLPRTGFHNDTDNEVARMFWGRVHIMNATAFMVFQQESRYRHIIHDIKYRGNFPAAMAMGRLFGKELAGTPFASADVIHPVPLHRSKLRKRGYNQSAMIARGMAEALNIPCEENIIVRKVRTGTQTSRSRYERWENVRGTFRLKKKGAFTGKHVIIVDDVVTTGATLEACASEVLQEEGVVVSLAALGYVKLG